MFRLMALTVLVLNSLARVSAHQDDKANPGDRRHHFLIGVSDHGFDNGDIDVYWNNLVRSMEVKASGDIELNDEETDVKNISKNGFLFIEERNWMTYRTLEISVQANGALQRKFSLQGHESEFDAEAQTWLSRILPDLARRSGIGAKFRIQRIIEKQGVTAAINEMSLVESNRAVQIYFMEILNQPNMSSESLQKALRKVSKEMSSSSRLSETLILAAKKFSDDSLFTTALMKAAGKISSSSTQSETLVQLASMRKLDRPSAIAMAGSIEEISSSSSKEYALEAMAEHSPNDDDVWSAYLRAVESVSSSSEQGRALEALLKRADISRNVLFRFLKITEQIASSSVQSNVLTRFVKVCPNDDALLSTYLETVGRISSSSGQEYAVLAMLNKENLSVNLLTKTLNFANSEMSSRSARQAVVEKVSRLLSEKNK
jgi:hypothetical protein